MQIKSKKRKSRVLQDWIRDTILRQFIKLSAEDVRCAIMGERGADLKLSKKALKYIPFKIEAKNWESFKNIYKAYDQACAHKEKGNPLVIIKSNRRQPLAIMDAKDFFKLICWISNHEK